MENPNKNNNTNISSTLQEIIEFVILLTICGMTLYFSTISQNAFSIPKATIVRVACALIFPLWLFQSLFFKNSNRNILSSLFTALGSAYTTLVFLFIISTIISTYVNIDTQTTRYITIWGASSRQLGLLTILPIISFYFFIVAAFKNLSQIVRAAKLIVSISAIAGLYGIFQFIHIDITGWQGVTDRAFSSFAHPIFWGEYLVMVMPLTLGLILYNKLQVNIPNSQITSRSLILFERFWLYIVLFIQIFNILPTKARGTWIAFSIEILLFIVIFFKMKLPFKLLYKIKFSILLLLSVCIISILSLYAQQVVFKEILTTKNRLSDILNTAKIKIQNKNTAKYTEGYMLSIPLRFELWKTSLKIIKKHFIFGIGPENQRYYFLKYKTIKTAQLGDINRNADRAHNIYIDNFLMYGFIGTTFYLLIVLISLIKGLQILVSDSPPELTCSKIILFGFLVGLTGYLINGISTFDSPQMMFYQWLYISLIVSLLQMHKGTEELSIVDCRLSIENSNNQRQNIEHRTQNTDAVDSGQSADRDAKFGRLYNRKSPNYQITKLPNRLQHSALKICIIIIISIGCFFYAYWSIKIFAADIYAKSALIQYDYGNLNNTEKYLKNALRLNPYESHYHTNLAKFYASILLSNNNDFFYTNNLKKSAISEFRKGIFYAYEKEYRIFDLAEFNYNYYKMFNRKEYLYRTIKELEQATKIDKYYPQALFLLSQAYYDKLDSQGLQPYYEWTPQTREKTIIKGRKTIESALKVYKYNAVPTEYRKLKQKYRKLFYKL